EERPALLWQRARMAMREAKKNSGPQEHVARDRDRRVQKQSVLAFLSLECRDGVAHEEEHEHRDRGEPVQCDGQPSVAGVRIPEPHRRYWSLLVLVRLSASPRRRKPRRSAVGKIITRVVRMPATVALPSRVAWKRSVILDLLLDYSASGRIP